MKIIIHRSQFPSWNQNATAQQRADVFTSVLGFKEYITHDDQNIVLEVDPDVALKQSDYVFATAHLDNAPAFQLWSEDGWILAAQSELSLFVRHIGGALLDEPLVQRLNAFYQWQVFYDGLFVSVGDFLLALDGVQNAPIAVTVAFSSLPVLSMDDIRRRENSHSDTKTMQQKLVEYVSELS